MDVVYDEHKLTELIVYLTDRLAGTAAALAQALFFVDFTHVRTHRAPITGAEYQRLADGPTPRRLAPICDHLADSGDAELVDDEHSGQSQHRVVARRPADLSVFTADEMRTIDQVVDDLASKTAAEVRALSREEAAWRHIDDGDTIPYELAFVPKEQVVTPTARRLGAEVARRYQLADSG